MARHSKRAVALAIVAATLVGTASAAPDGFIVYKVGAAAECTFHTIQEAVDAAAAHPGVDLVWIAMDQDYTDQHVVVADQDVDIQGGFTDCFDNDNGPEQTKLVGTSGHSVLEIEGTSNVFVQNLEITGAVMDEDHSGGGIYFGGQGSLTLQTSWVHLNQAGYGGGIDVSPSGQTTVTLTGSVVSANTALVSGGGIRIEGDTTLNVEHANDGVQFDFVTNNHALGHNNIGFGGGIEVLGPAVANVAAVVAQNDAQYGGGIAALAGEHGGARVNLYAVNPGSPAAIYENAASGTGGGVFLKPYADMGTNATLCAQNFDIHSNTASNGGAIYADLDGDKGSGVLFNGACDGPPQGVACAAGVPCNTIHDNTTVDGSTILVQSKGFFAGDRFEMRHNGANSVIGELTDAPTLVTISNCLLADNTVSGSLIEGGTPGGLDIASALYLDSCTMAGNAIGAAEVVRTTVSIFGLSNSIVDQPGKVTVDAPIVAPFQIAYVLSNDVSTLPPIDGVAMGEPTFVDAANGDYRLQPTSLGVDFAPVGTTPFDLDGLPRAVDLGAAGNLWGPMDLGAYEIQGGTVVDDTIFGDGFD
ncbi:MAG TPA: hypothetical protein VKB52_16870 [Rhodanobacteraceae bacterium]|nr:hypothetical protein [Rhodanobacteraceae bacterium]